MDYKKLCYGYKSLFINFDDALRFLKKDEKYIEYQKLLTKEMRSLIKVSRFDYIYTLREIYKDKILYLDITKDGIFLDITPIKKALAGYFRVKYDENLRKNLETAKAKIKDGTFNYYRSLFYFDTPFEHYDTELDNKKLNKKIRRNIRKNLLEEIETFEKVLDNEKEYCRVEDVFDEDKVALYLANTVMRFAKKYKNRGDEDRFIIAFNYLKKYVENNSKLISNNYSMKFDFYYDGYYHKAVDNIKYFNTRDIVDFVTKYSPKIVKVEDKKKIENVDEYNYSFFECDKEQGKKLLGEYFKFAFDKIDTDELKKELKRKKEFYDSIDYVKIKVGTDSFDGYIGFELANGYVILDKMYDNYKENVIAKENAIYIIKIDDFDVITRMSKSETIEAIQSGRIKAKRVYHVNDYESRVKKYINS